MLERYQPCALARIERKQGQNLRGPLYCVNQLFNRRTTVKVSQQPKPQPNNRYREYPLSFPSTIADAIRRAAHSEKITETEFIKRAVVKALAAPASEDVATEAVAA